MGFFTKKPAQPYRNDALNKSYELLFCDNAALYNTNSTSSAGYPWNILLANRPTSDQLTQIADDESLEARQRLLAYNRLLANGAVVTKKILLGVVIEVSLEGGLDVLAAFNDGTARYINHSERMIVWETQTADSNQLVGQLLSASMNVVQRIGKWDGQRRPHPTNGVVRLNFLVSDGLYFGEGPFGALYADAMGKSVIDAATSLMNYLMHCDLNRVS